MQDRLKHSPKKGKAAVHRDASKVANEWHDSKISVDEEEELWAHFRPIENEPEVPNTSEIPAHEEPLHRNLHMTNPTSRNTAYVVFHTHKDAGIFYNWSSCSDHLSTTYGQTKPFYKGFLSEDKAEADWEYFKQTGEIPEYLQSTRYIKKNHPPIATPVRNAHSPRVITGGSHRYSPVPVLASTKRLLSPRAVPQSPPFRTRGDGRPETPTPLGSASQTFNHTMTSVSNVTVRTPVQTRQSPVQTRQSSVPPKWPQLPTPQRQASVPPPAATPVQAQASVQEDPPFNTIRVSKYSAYRWHRCRKDMMYVPEDASEYFVLLKASKPGIYTSVRDIISACPRDPHSYHHVYKVDDRALAFQIFAESFINGDVEILDAASDDGNHNADGEGDDEVDIENIEFFRF